MSSTDIHDMRRRLLDHEATIAKREQVGVDSLRQTFFAIYWNLLNSMKESAR
jgi:hypothetical protein